MREHRFSAWMLALGFGLMTIPSWAHAAETEVAAEVPTVEADASDRARYVVEPCAYNNCASEASDEAAESPISGGVDVMSDYMLDDAVRSTPGPVFQPWVSVDLGDGLSVNVWGSKNLDPDNNFGNELDLGITYERSLGGGVTGRVVLNHYVLFGDVPDMQEITIGAQKDGLDLSVSYYPWAGGLEDGFRMGAIYSFEVAPRLSASAGIVYETGFEVDDTVVASAGLNYDLGHGFSAKVNGYLPHRDDGVHERRIVFGIGWSF